MSRIFNNSFLFYNRNIHQTYSFISIMQAIESKGNIC